MRGTLARRDPFRDLVSIQDELNRLFGRTFGGFEPLRPSAAGTWAPALDVYETDEKVVAKMDLPGIDPKDVEVSFDKGVLTVGIPKIEKAKPKVIQIKAKA